MRTVAVIGLGEMGTRIARRLVSQDYEVVVWNRTRDKATELFQHGVASATTPAEAASRADVVVTIVSDPGALVAVTEGPNGVVAGLQVGGTLIEMSTVGPGPIHRLASLLPDRAHVLDAPVLGSLSEAESGSLNILVGGAAATVERCRPLLEVLGSPLHIGSLGAGAAAKLVANSSLFGILGVLAESLALADALGLSRHQTFDVLGLTPLAAQAERRRANIQTEEFPRRFALSLAHKDAELISRAGAAAGLDLAIADTQRRRLAAAHAAGWGERDYSSLLVWPMWFR
jgi:3-hydroxyisobutyrate dehydrogenase-like beta-hydroxyacid dehydrogenase